ncbi:MAG: response regulator transcription factor [Bacteroidetes bacterium]|nr:response regulator transcription factor [Bacteroidota bacterium]MBS1631210.1 response regulator transcription factor [Bacteroidota bacterium]
MISVALVDDHVLLRNGLATLVKMIGFNVLFEADHGEELIKKINSGLLPEVVLMDINMRVLDGYDATGWIKQHHPEIKVLALTMVDDENAIIKMLKCGARGYLLKECSAAELKNAIKTVAEKGFYYSEMVTGRLIHNISVPDNEAVNHTAHLTDKEIEFLKLACSELTYKEIAYKMKVSPRTIDTYRDHLFEKLELKTRTGLAIYAIKNGLTRP